MHLIGREVRIELPTVPDGPLVSIGMPVHNGERHIARALECLLAQDMVDFEVLISDNASNDRTPEICARFAQLDNRIEYFRNETNIGAAGNFNKVFRLAVGEYFMWAAHDDEWAPTYVSRCVELLERRPSTVLSISQITFITESGESKGVRPKATIDTDGLEIAERVHQFMMMDGWYFIYGLMRRQTLGSTELFRNTFGGDVQLMLELILQGDIGVVPEPLFRYRTRYRRNQNEAWLLSIIGGVPKELLSTPQLDLARNLIEVADKHILDSSLREQIRVSMLRDLVESRAWRRKILHEQGWPTLWPYSDDLLLRQISDWLRTPETTRHAGQRKPKRDPLPLLRTLFLAERIYDQLWAMVRRRAGAICRYAKSGATTVLGRAATLVEAVRARIAHRP